VTYFYLTWARRNSPADQAALTQAYQAIARELGATVAPVGIAWEKVLREDPKVRLHMEDDSHPNATGTYLAALVFLARLRGKLPAELPATIPGIPEGEGKSTYP
jgi:hypothetical protein